MYCLFILFILFISYIIIYILVVIVDIVRALIKSKLHLKLFNSFIESVVDLS